MGDEYTGLRGDTRRGGQNAMQRVLFVVVVLRQYCIKWTAVKMDKKICCGFGSGVERLPD